MDVNDPGDILVNVVILGVFAGIVVYTTSMTVERALDLATANPLIAGGIGVFVVFLLLFGDQKNTRDDGP